MNPEIKQKWLTALRSGEYKQGKGALHLIQPECKQFDQPKSESFCCLGILCDIHAKETGISWYEEPKNSSVLVCGYLGIQTSLPHVVTQWAGLNNSNPMITMPGAKEYYSAASANDEGKSFAEIADLIEKNL